MPVLSVKNISFHYPESPVAALNDVSFEVEAGDYLVILGANGSGKSTLSRLLCGFLPCSAGKILVQEDLRTGIVFQAPKEQIVAGIVERDTAFGPQNLNLRKAEVELRTIEALAAVGLLDRANSHTFSLSLGQTQKLALSGILALSPDIFILDEVTAMLDPGSRADVLEFLEHLHRRRHTVIHITHDRSEVQYANKVLVLKEGSVAFYGSRTALEAEGTLLSTLFGAPLPVAARVPATTDIVFRAEKINFSYSGHRVLCNVDIVLQKGTMTALTGASGSGKTTFLEIAAGLLRQDSGHIYAQARPVLAQQESEAALFERIAADDVAFGPRNQGLTGAALVERVRSAMNSCALPFDSFGEQFTFALSGGEKRKLSLAGIVAMNSDILLFDEPTAGLDPQSRTIILKALKNLCAQGKTILFTTHRMEEADFADCHIHLEEGHVTASAQSHAADTEGMAEFTVMQNARLIPLLQKAGKSFTAPAKVPDSLVSRLPSVLKYIVFLALFALALLQKTQIMCISAVAASVAYACAAHYPLRRIAKTFLLLLPWLALFAVFDGFVFGFSQATLRHFAFLCGRCIAAFTCIAVFMHTTNERQLLDGLSALLFPLHFLRIPTRYVVLIVGIIFRFVPLLLDEACGIIKTQLIRGALGEARGPFAKVRLIFPLVIPLIIQTLKKAEALGDALAARYFH